MDEVETQDSAAQRPSSMPMKPIPSWAIWLGIALLLLVAGGSTWLLVAAFGGGSVQDKIRLESIRLAGSIALGTGGVAALLLTARRQRTTELGLLQQEQAQLLQEQRAIDARHDADERRITELYTAAAEQLASERPLARMAGLYALSRLGNQNPTHRQNVIDLLCACLHVTTPSSVADTNEIPESDGNMVTPSQYLQLDLAPKLAKAAEIANDAQDSEKQVRNTAGRLLEHHLGNPTSPDNPDFWPNMDLNLSNTTLADFRMCNCFVRNAAFEDSVFYGNTDFTGTTFQESASFDYAKFTQIAEFMLAKLPVMPSFVGTQFGGIAVFSSTNLDYPHFWNAIFWEAPVFFDVSLTDSYESPLGVAEKRAFSGATLRLNNIPKTWSEEYLPRGWSVHKDAEEAESKDRWGKFVHTDDDD